MRVNEEIMGYLWDYLSLNNRIFYNNQKRMDVLRSAQAHFEIKLDHSYELRDGRHV